MHIYTYTYMYIYRYMYVYIYIYIYYSIRPPFILFLTYFTDGRQRRGG